MNARVRGWEWLLIAALAGVAALLRAYQIDAQSLWLDEALSVWRARQPVAAVLAELASTGNHTPLYFVLLSLWVRAVGDGESAVRSLSALFGVATVPVTYLLARRLLGVVPAVAATVLLVVSPIHVRYAQEARTYTLLTLGASVALLALAHILTGDRRRRWWAAIVLSSALTLHLHNTALLFLLALNVAFGAAALLARTTPQFERPRLRDWLLAQAAIVLLWAPWLPTMYAQMRRVDESFWIPPLSIRTILHVISDFVSDFGTPAWAWLWVAATVALLLALLALGRKPALLALLALLVVTPLAAEVLISLRRPILLARTLLWTTVPLYVLLAAGVAQRRSLAAAAAAALCVFLVGNVLSLHTYFNAFTKEQWREAAATVAARAGEDDRLLFHARYGQIPFDYYFERLPPHARALQVSRRGVPEGPSSRMTEADVMALRDAVAGARCVWLVYSHDSYTDPDQIIPRVLREELAAAGSIRFVGVELQLYARPDAPCGTLP
jgi:mannosyltransferase